MCKQPFSKLDEIDSDGETVNTIVFQMGCGPCDSEEEEDVRRQTSYYCAWWIIAFYFFDASWVVWRAVSCACRKRNF
jgi:hypothetical protein